MPLKISISDATSVFVISCFIYLSKIQSVLGGVTTLGLPNLTPFSFAILIPSACLYAILVKELIDIKIQAPEIVSKMLFCKRENRNLSGNLSGNLFGNLSGKTITKQADGWYNGCDNKRC